MTDFINDDVFDAALDEFALATTMHICSGDPADRAAANTNSLGNYTLTAGAGNGDYTIANGDTSGRKITVTAQSGNNATATGTAAVVCGIDATRLVWKVDLSATQGVTSGNPLDVAAFDYEQRDPT